MKKLTFPSFRGLNSALPVIGFYLTAFVYPLIFFFHLWLGLPVTKSYFWLAIFFFLGLGFLATALIWKWIPLILCGAFFLAPFPVTIFMGYVAFANTYEASPPDREAVEFIVSAPRNPFAIHISDSHLLGPEERQTREGASRDRNTLNQLSAAILKLHPRYLFITGDVTDKGKDTEWKVAEEILLKPAREAGITTIIAPGNHDLQPTFFGAKQNTYLSASAAALARALLEKQVAFGGDLTSVSRGALRSLMNWQPSEAEITETSQKFYQTCIENPPDPNTPPLAWAQGCDLATRPEVIKELLLNNYFSQACSDWYPFTHYDADIRTETIVMCSVGSSTLNIGDNAIGSFGKEQLKRFGEALDQIPADANHVFIVLHHPVVRRWRDTYSVPEHWWRWHEWTESSLYNYALLSTEWREASAVVDKTLQAMEKRPACSFNLLYGHRHQPSLSGIRTDRYVLGLSEAPAFGEGEPGFRACYLQDNSNQLLCKWLRM